MKPFKLFRVVMSVSMAISGEIAEAWEDGILNGKEMASIIKNGIMGLRMAGVSQKDLDQIQVVTQRYELEALSFKDGDIAVYGPQELINKLKIKV